jgi:septal ring factor EnvC (AmiA/AmiB activator)
MMAIDVEAAKAETGITRTRDKLYKTRGTLQKSLDEQQSLQKEIQQAAGAHSEAKESLRAVQESMKQVFAN